MNNGSVCCISVEDMRTGLKRKLSEIDNEDEYWLFYLSLIDNGMSFDFNLDRFSDLAYCFDTDSLVNFLKSKKCVNFEDYDKDKIYYIPNWRTIVILVDKEFVENDTADLEAGIEDLDTYGVLELVKLFI